MNAPRPTAARAYRLASLPAGDRCATRGRLREPARGRLEAGALLGGRPLAPTRPRRWARSASAWRWSASADTELPDLPGTERWDEPDEPRHPLTGIVHALATAGGPVLVCAADMPFVTADACRTLLQAAATGAGGGGDRRRRPAADARASTRRPRWTCCAPRPPTRRSRARSRRSTRSRVALPRGAGAQRQHARRSWPRRRSCSASGTPARSAPTARSSSGAAGAGSPCTRRACRRAARRGR